MIKTKTRNVYEIHLIIFQIFSSIKCRVSLADFYLNDSILQHVLFATRIVRCQSLKFIFRGYKLSRYYLLSVGEDISERTKCCLARREENEKKILKMLSEYYLTYEYIVWLADRKTYLYRIADLFFMINERDSQG